MCSSYQQQWKVPQHFTSCAKHWPATTGAPPPGTIAELKREDGSLTARAVDDWARQVTDRAPMSRGAIDAWERQITGRPPAPQTRELPSGVTFEPYPARRTPGGVPYRAPAAITTYGVPADCTCVPAHAHAALANTHVRHRVGCAARHEPRARDWR